MKKTYINPTMVAVPITHTQPVAASISTINGITDLDFANEDDELPVDADVKGFGHINVWDVEW